MSGPGSPSAPAPRALLSVYDKQGLVELASGLDSLGWELVASGQTSAALKKAGIPHRQVSEVTGSPEMLDGRVKTLHPKIHGGILADRSKPEHLADLEAQSITPVDLVVSNLYPFGSEPSVEMIDIGGPAMVRAAAKNFAHVGVVVDPSDYGAVLDELRSAGTLSEATRLGLSRRAFAHTAAYDAAIVSWLDAGAVDAGAVDAGVVDAGVVDAGAGGGEAGEAVSGSKPDLPPTIHLSLERVQSLRYGENPHQQGARYRLIGEQSWWDGVVQHSGKELSYLNLLDADAAWRLVHEMLEVTGGLPRRDGVDLSVAGWSAVAIIKHANPCGAAMADDPVAAYEAALEADRLSAFGGIVALSHPVTPALAQAIGAGPQADVIVAPEYEPEALRQLQGRRKATRLLAAPSPEPQGRQLRTLGASVLVQVPDPVSTQLDDWRVVTKATPTALQWRDLALAWLLCARTSSNAVTVVNGDRAVGVGAGQQSRVVAAELAVGKAGDRARGGAGASDAFFPFPDGLQVLADAGVAVVAQPGGSVRDDEVIAAADAAGMSMVLTGERHFRH